MPSHRLPSSIRWLAAFLGLASGLAAAPGAAAGAGIAVLHSPSSSPGDIVRDGAGELEVLMSVARVQRDHRAVGVVGVGNRHGVFPPGGERALRFFALEGVPVAKLARGSDLAADPEGLFLDGGSLTEAGAAAVLARCLDQFGAPPVAADPDRPTTGELAAIRARLRPFREAFALAGGQRVAMR